MIIHTSQLLKIKKFTLTELLIVISILMILISLLSPSLKNISHQANTVSCTNNLNQIHLSSSQYSLDYSNILVPLSQGPSFQRKSWMWSLSPYLGMERENKNPHIKIEVPAREASNLMCPSASDIHLLNYGSSFRVTTYSYNMYSGFRNRVVNDNLKTFNQVVLTNISKPDQAYMFLDANSSFLFRYDYYKLNSNGLGQDYLYRHLNGQNRLAADGHIQYGIANLDLPSKGYWYKWAWGYGS